MKKISLLVIIAIITITQTRLSAQNISSHFSGINAWMPDTIGDITRNSNCVLYGKLHKNWNAIKSTGTRLVRYGGIAVDENKPTNYQYIRVIDSVRANGMEPVVQVPFYNNKYSSAEAAEIVKYVNVVRKRNVKYWIIGNEPDLVYNYSSASQVADYIKKFASAMKAADPGICIVGPETAWYNKNILHGLTNPGGPDDITGKDASGRYYIDVISFHTYPFNGSQSRSGVISKLTEPQSLQDNLTDLHSRISQCNSYHQRSGNFALKTAITEANVNYLNSETDNLYGSGANSFIGGQFIAEMMCIAMKKSVDFMCIWSVIEGNNTSSNIGILDRNSANKKSSFYHFKIVSENFKGVYCNGTDNNGNVKAFGSKSANQIAVLILNQDEWTDLNYTVRLNKDVLANSSTLKINIDASVSKEYSHVIARQSTLLLLFDTEGNIIKKIEYKLSGDADINQPARTIELPKATITAAGATEFCAYEQVVLNATPGPGYKYQWRKDGIDIGGATGTSLTVSASGKYSVLVENSGLYTVSNSIPVHVKTFTVTLASLGKTSVCTGEKVLLQTDSFPGRSYQWRKEGIAITGADKNTYTAISTGSYSVKIMENGCHAWSAPLDVNISSPPIPPINTTGPASFCQGGNVLLKTDSVPGRAYQWRKDGIGITGANKHTYAASSAGSYSVKITENGCNAWSAPLNVIISNPPVPGVYAAGPTNFCQGGAVLLKTDSVPGRMYQWRKDGIGITGANKSTFKATSAGNYSVKITENGCNAWSAPLNVSTYALTASITAQGSTVFASGGNVVLSANNAYGYSYQWFKNGKVIAGATSSLYKATASGEYTVKITDGACTAASAPIRVVVLAKHDGYIPDLAFREEPAPPIAIMDGENTTSNRFAEPEEEETKAFEAEVYPNPSQDRFFIRISSRDGNTSTLVRVLDLEGKIHVMQRLVDPEQEMSFGDALLPGYYIVEVIQGEDKESFKIIKN